jgi:hypothetical protein
MCVVCTRPCASACALPQPFVQAAGELHTRRTPKLAALSYIDGQSTDRTHPKPHWTNDSTQYCGCDPTISPSAHRGWLMPLLVKLRCFFGSKYRRGIGIPAIRLERCLTRSHSWMPAMKRQSGSACRNHTAAGLSIQDCAIATFVQPHSFSMSHLPCAKTVRERFHATMTR